MATIVAFALAGCAIKQQVDPVAQPISGELCVIENPDVRAEFLDAYKGALQAKGFEVRVLPRSSTLDDCRQISRYTANWQWDLAMYLKFADISVYVDGQRVGHALYDSAAGPANPGKFISAENKVKELVDELFPGPTKAAGETHP